MNKAELVDAIAGKTGDSKAAAGASLDATLEIIGSALARGEKVQLTGFGTFERRHRAARMGRNPRTGAAVPIAASNVPAFKAGKALKDMVNQ